MPITEPLIEEAYERFLREWDRYEKLTRTVEAICRERIAEGSSLRVNITARTKSPASFRRKLRRFASNGQKDSWSTSEDVFSGLSDFSGVRVAYYLSGDEEGVKSALLELFYIPDGFDEKDKRGGKYPRHSNYKATHCQAMLKDEQLAGASENLRGLSCEIQVCSMMAHVWNEIEHDIAYKPVGTLGDGEKAELAALADLVRDGDGVIQRLLRAHSERVAQEDAIESPVELAAYVADLFDIGRVTFWGSVGRVHESLQRLGLCGKRSLASAIGVSPDWKSARRRQVWSDARRKTHQLNRWLTRAGHPEFLLAERNSADPLLVMLLERRHDWVLTKLPAGRGKGRPAWVRGLASRYAEARRAEKLRRKP